MIVGWYIGSGRTATYVRSGHIVVNRILAKNFPLKKVRGDSRKRHRSRNWIGKYEIKMVS